MGLSSKLSLTTKLTLALAYVFTSQAQFVRPPTDLISKAGAAGVSVRYKKVPAGFCETRANLTHLSGFADVSPDSHIHFQFFETRKGDPKKAPLTVWINGGPGSSSMIGLYREVGPCSINPELKTQDNPFAWNEVSNMLFIDQPVTTGNSYSNVGPAYVNADGYLLGLPEENCPDYARDIKTCGTYSSNNVQKVPRSTADAAQSFYLALQGFVGAFPEYGSALNIASESYGGHYVPAFSQMIVEKKREATPGHVPLDLRTAAIGNGWYSAVEGYTSYLNFMKKNAYGIAFQNDSIINEVNNSLIGPGNCIDQISACLKSTDDLVCYQAKSYCDNTVQTVILRYLDRSVYDVRQREPSPFPPTYGLHFLNLESTQSALGLFQNFTVSSDVIIQAFSWSSDSLREGAQTIDKLRFLLDNGVHVAMFVGDADWICNFHLQDATSKMIGAKGFAEAGWNNLTTSDGIVHGQTKQSGGFSYTQFYLAGHEVPFYQPLASLEFFDRVINRKDIATGKVDIQPGSTYKTVGPTDNFVFHGNSTVETDKLPEGSDYDLVTSKAKPNPKSAKNLLLGGFAPPKKPLHGAFLPMKTFVKRSRHVSLPQDRL